MFKKEKISLKYLFGFHYFDPPIMANLLFFISTITFFIIGFYYDFMFLFFNFDYNYKSLDEIIFKIIGIIALSTWLVTMIIFGLRSFRKNSKRLKFIINPSIAIIIIIAIIAFNISIYSLFSKLQNTQAQTINKFLTKLDPIDKNLISAKILPERSLVIAKIFYYETGESKYDLPPFFRTQFRQHLTFHTTPD